MKKLIVLIPLLLLSLASSALAQETKSFSINPVYPEPRQHRADYQAHPGDVIEDYFYVVNNSDTDTFNLELGTADYQKASHGGFGLEVNPKDNKGIGVWTEVLGEKNITLKPGEKYKFGVKLKVPAETKPGQYWGGVYATNHNAGSMANGAKFGIRVVSRIYLQVFNHETPIQASILNLDMDQIRNSERARFQFYLSLAISISLLFVLVATLTYTRRKGAIN